MPRLFFVLAKSRFAEQAPEFIPREHEALAADRSAA
jgi:hypothetical protein